MEIKELDQLLSNALQAPEDSSLREKYCDAVTDYLKTQKSSAEIVSIVIRGIDIDRAANFFDYLEEASQNDLQSLCKQIRLSKNIKKCSDKNILKFLAGMLSLALMKIGNVESQLGSIIGMLVSLIASENNAITPDIYAPIICDYLLDDLDPQAPLPKWESVKISDESKKLFAEILLKATADDKTDKYKFINLWASRGLHQADEQIKKKKIEERIPKSRIEDLLAIADHYRTVERQIRENVYAMAGMEEEISNLQKDVKNLRVQKHNLEAQVVSLNKEIDSRQQSLAKAEKEVEERAAINDAFGALKKDDETALLKDIASDLKAEYRDFIDSMADDMDIQLGEIYREKLKNIFKILNKKGITME